MEKPVQLRLLGAVQVGRGGEPVHGFRSRKALAILSYLAVEKRPVPREQLVDLFWPDQSESRGRANLSWALNHISSHLPDCLSTDRHTVQFCRSDSCWVDTDAFAELESREEIAALAAAVELCRGEFLEGLHLDGCPEYEIWVVGERERWRQRVTQALESLVTHHGNLGDYEEGLRLAQRLLALEPWREETHRQVMLLLAHSGQRSGALAQYETCRRVLAEGLNVEPAEETTTLYERIRAADAMRRHNLPATPTPFVGREEELAHIDSLLVNADCRLLTIYGPGGIGKTRVALQAAAARTESFLEGVCFVPLAAVGSAESLVSAIADGLGLSLVGARDPQAQLVDYLRTRETLLILDSFEHLLEETALLGDILTEAPAVKLLITSREWLDLRWEWRFEIQGLAFPSSGDEINDTEELIGFDAVQLFQQAAQRARPGFTLSDGDGFAVMRICQLVEGMPLALELAAALVKTRTCEETAGEIEHNLSSLATTFRDMPPRQRSLRATFDHSWRLLSPAEQNGLAQLSVFRGGFKAEAATEVSGVGSDTLESLASKSLLRFSPAGRFEMHEFARQYAAEKLRAMPEVGEKTGDRHCAYYTAFLERHEAALVGAGMAQAKAAIGAELANARAAWRWAVAHARPAEILRGLAGLSRFLVLSGLYQEGEALIEMAVDLLRTSAEKADGPARDLRIALGRALAERARFLNRLGVYDEAIRMAREAVELVKTEEAKGVEAAAYLQWGQALFRQGGLEAAEAQLEEALTVARASGSRQLEADSLRFLGNVLHGRGAYPEAGVRFEEALSIYREMSDGRGEGGALNNLGAVCQAMGDNAGATAYYEQALDVYRQIGDRQIGGAALHNLARVSLQQGAYTQARTHLEQALQIWRDVGDRQGEGWGLLNLGCIAIEQNAYVEAVVRCEQALRVFRDIGDRRGEGNALIDLGLALGRRGNYAQAVKCLEKALYICREVSDRQGEGWALNHLGRFATDCGDYTGAKESLEQALRVSQEIGDRASEGKVLTDLCLLFHLLGENEMALEYGQQALIIVQELGDRAVEAICLNRQGNALVGLGRLEEAGEVCRRALELRRELGLHHLATESLAALARITLARDDSALAQSQVDEILVWLEGNPPEGTDEPLRVYLTCYRVLRRAGDRRAESVLAAACQLLRERAAKIGDDELRRSFLENISTHREIAKEIERCQP